MRFVFAVIFSIILAGAAHAADPITGNWVSQDGKGVVTIAPCGKAVCGHITRFTEKGRIEGPATDSHNPDPTLRARSLIGVQVLTDFVADGKEWRGSLYYPFGGKVYRAFISRNPDNSLKVRGCWYFICRTVKWPSAEGVH